MNVKVRMPKFGKKLRTKKYWIKELLMTILATSISIVLTFGSANLVEGHQKKKAQRRMAMMVIHDIDESIKQMEQVDSILRGFRDTQFQVLEGTYHEPLDYAWIMLASYDPGYVKFAETTEHIFTSNVDTWSTIGKVDFIDNVSGCYILRNEYKTEIIDAFHELVAQNGDFNMSKLDELLAIKTEYYVACSSGLINELKAANELNKRIMGISDKDYAKFNSRMIGYDQSDLDALYDEVDKEYINDMERKARAMDNFKKNRATMYPDMGKGRNNK